MARPRLARRLDVKMHEGIDGALRYELHMLLPIVWHLERAYGKCGRATILATRAARAVEALRYEMNERAKSEV